MSGIAHAGFAPRLSAGGLGAVVLLHGLLLWALLRLEVVTLPAPLAVLSVSVLPSIEPAPPRPEVVPPKPRPVDKRPQPQPTPAPVPLAVAAEAPAAAAAPTPVAVAPAPTFSPPAPPAAPTVPRFDADYLDNPKPHYPPLSRRLGEQGRVVLRVQVDAAGAATEVQLHASSGYERLDAAALATVRRWKFVPARRGSEPVAAGVLVPIVFSLKD
jgi:protein TonB